MMVDLHRNQLSSLGLKKRNSKIITFTITRTLNSTN